MLSRLTTPAPGPATVPGRPQRRAHAHRTLAPPRAVDPASNPLFASNPAFAAALAGALDRNGEAALAAGRAKEEDDRQCAIVQVLHDSMRTSRRTVVELEAIHKAVGNALEREKTQFERLQFALKKATDDDAFRKSMAKVVARNKEELEAYRAKYGELEK